MQFIISFSIFLHLGCISFRFRVFAYLWLATPFLLSYCINMHGRNGLNKFIYIHMNIRVVMHAIPISWCTWISNKILLWKSCPRVQVFDSPGFLLIALSVCPQNFAFIVSSLKLYWNLILQELYQVQYRFWFDARSKMFQEIIDFHDAWILYHIRIDTEFVSIVKYRLNYLYPYIDH